jgi:hypothetical membrane protein
MFLRAQSFRACNREAVLGCELMAKAKSPSLVRVSGGYGVLAPVFAFGSILLAVASYSEFSWLDNALSDLGIVPGITSSIFNSGLAISGVLFLTFTMGLYFFAGENRAGRVGVFILAAACAALVSISIFPENIKPVHYIASVAFFTLLPIALLTIAGSFWLSHKKQMTLFTLLVALIAAIPWVLQLSLRIFSGVAIPEFVSALAGAVWVAFFAIKMTREDPLSDNFL